MWLGKFSSKGLILAAGLFAISVGNAAADVVITAQVTVFGREGAFGVGPQIPSLWNEPGVMTLRVDENELAQVVFGSEVELGGFEFILNAGGDTWQLSDLGLRFLDDTGIFDDDDARFLGGDGDWTSLPSLHLDQITHTELQIPLPYDGTLHPSEIPYDQMVGMTAEELLLGTDLGFVSGWVRIVGPPDGYYLSLDIDSYGTELVDAIPEPYDSMSKER